MPLCAKGTENSLEGTGAYGEHTKLHNQETSGYVPPYLYACRRSNSDEMREHYQSKEADQLNIFLFGLHKEAKYVSKNLDNEQ